MSDCSVSAIFAFLDKQYGLVCMQSIHPSVEKLQEFGDLELGKGAKHPTLPNQSLSQEVNAFIDTYSFLRQDSSYIDFLESYSGLTLLQTDGSGSLSIYGFDDDTALHLVKGEGELIDDFGILTFADLFVCIIDEDRGEKCLSFGFGFDTTQQRTWGVYQSTDTEPWHWYCSTFLELLDSLVKKGVFSVGD